VSPSGAAGREFDLRVYVVTAEVPALGRTHEQVVAAALAGGATAIQFRDKTMSAAAFLATARRLLALTRAARVPLIVNDRAAAAIAAGADGLHIGQSDGDVAEVKRLLPPEMILGVSATNFAEAVAMDATAADHLGVGPIFATPSKSDATPPMGLEELARICRAVRKPVVAIGGLTTANLPEVIAAGVRGAAVISAVTHAPDMAAATAELKRVWNRCVAKRT
jgi:thiamine-phosphate pyrophosphorylase